MFNLQLVPCLVTDPNGGGSEPILVVIKAVAEEPSVQVRREECVCGEE